jgi:cytidylate kinase
MNTNGNSMVVVIDGPAASGKSTTARKVAEKLGWFYLDTGAMYRAVTVKVLRERIPLDDSKAIARAAEKMKIRLQPSREGLKIFVDDKDVSSEIRTPEVDQAVGPVCEVGKVREILVRKQQEIGASGHVIAEGRDMGTVVFPNADLKFYMTASVEERAKRRQKDLEKQGFEISFEAIKSEILRRDERDSTRSNSPLKQAEDAVQIDTTGMKIEDQVNRIIDRIMTKQALLKKNG